MFTLNELSMEEVIMRFPVVGTSAVRSKPSAKMSGDGIEVGPKPIGSKSGDTSMSQTQIKVMQEGISRIGLS